MRHSIRRQVDLINQAGLMPLEEDIILVNSSMSIKPSPSPSTALTMLRQALTLKLSPSFFSTWDSSWALIFPSPSKSNTLNAFSTSSAFVDPPTVLNISTNSLNSIAPSPSESISWNAFATSESAISLSRALSADLYSSWLILPSLLASNLSKVHFISSTVGSKLLFDDALLNVLICEDDLSFVLFDMLVVCCGAAFLLDCFAVERRPESKLRKLKLGIFIFMGFYFYFLTFIALYIEPNMCHSIFYTFF